MIDKYRYAANDITSNNQHMYGYKEIELESHVHIQANRATSFRLFFPWASLLNHQVNVQMNEQNDQGNSYILLLPMFTCSWCHHMFAERKSPDKKNLLTLKKALVSIWHYKSAYWLQLTTLVSSIICNLGKSKNKSIPSLRLERRETSVRTGTTSKGITQPTLQESCTEITRGNISVTQVIVAAYDGFYTRKN